MRCRKTAPPEPGWSGGSRPGAERRGQLAEIARALDADTGDDENIWQRAILDDADNDCTTIAHGPLRDIALADALRKARQSQRISYITALVLARRLEMGEAGDAPSGMAEGAGSVDDTLAEALERLCGGVMDW